MDDCEHNGSMLRAAKTQDHPLGNDKAAHHNQGETLTL